MVEHDCEHLVRLVGPKSLTRIAEAIASGQGRPAKVSELELVVEWVTRSWATEAIVASVLDGMLIVLIEDGDLSFRGRTVTTGRLE